MKPHSFRFTAALVAAGLALAQSGQYKVAKTAKVGGAGGFMFMPMPPIGGCTFPAAETERE